MQLSGVVQPSATISLLSLCMICVHAASVNQLQHVAALCLHAACAQEILCASPKLICIVQAVQGPTHQVGMPKSYARGYVRSAHLFVPSATPFAQRTTDMRLNTSSTTCRTNPCSLVASVTAPYAAANRRCQCSKGKLQPLFTRTLRLFSSGTG